MVLQVSASFPSAVSSDWQVRLLMLFFYAHDHDDDEDVIDA